MNNEQLKNLFDEVDNLLKEVNLDKVTAESAGYEELTEGYYLSSVENAELTTSKTSGVPQVVFKMKVVEDGHNVVLDKSGDVVLTTIKGSKDRRFYLYFPFKDKQSIEKFVSNMLKFEGDEIGKPLLEKEYFTTAEVLSDALQILVGHHIYVQVSVTDKDGQTSTWKNMISWKRAAALELPLE